MPVQGRSTTSLAVELMNQSCMQCQAQWMHHAIGEVKYDSNGGTFRLICLKFAPSYTIERTRAIAPQPPAALDAPTLQLLRPYQKMIEPRRTHAR